MTISCMCLCNMCVYRSFQLACICKQKLISINARMYTYVSAYYMCPSESVHAKTYVCTYVYMYVCIHSKANSGKSN